MELIKCHNCKTDFRPSSDQLNFIHSSKEKGMTFIMLECRNCGRTFPFNPSDAKLLDIEPKASPIRTPISGSHGYVSFVESDNEKFYGCGETGAIWRNKENLFRDVELIINKYSHREKCYKKTGSSWIGNVSEPENMEELIDQEEIDEILDYERD